MPLKAARYIAQGVSPNLVATVEHELPYFSYDRALEFYETCIPAMRPLDLAFTAANDRFLLMTGILRRPDAIHPWVYERCREVEAEPDDRLDLWARYHYKSTIITFAGVIQEIINDPEITIAMFGGTMGIIEPHFLVVKSELEENELLKSLYSDVFWADPKKEAKGKWDADEGITVKRKGNPKERTLSCYGLIGGMPTGGHWKLRLYDDLVNETFGGSDSEIMIPKVIHRWEMSQNLGAGLQGDRKQHAGTRYFYADPYNELLRRGSLKPRIYTATEDGTLKGVPVMLSAEKWEDIKRDQTSTVSAQMLMNPLAGNDTMFKIEWLRPFQVRPRLLNVYILVDPSKGRSATSDRTAIAVIGVDSALNRYLLDGACHRMKMSERYRMVKELHRKWEHSPGVQSVTIGYEIIGQQVDDEYMAEKMEKDKYWMNIEEVNTPRDSRKRAKRDRVERIEPYFRDSQFFMPPKAWHPDHGACRWAVEPNTAAPVYTPIGKPVHNERGIAVSTIGGETREEMACRARGEPYRIMQPIIRTDEQGNKYDVFRKFIDEFIMFPFSQHDDFIDAMSRIQDMDVLAPIVVDRVRMQQIATADA